MVARPLAALLALSALAGCDEVTPRDHVQLTVHNAGFETVVLQLLVDRDERGDINQDYEVPLQSDFSQTFDDVLRLKLRAFRKSDSFKIFDDFWDPDDIDRVKGHIAVTVTP